MIKFQETSNLGRGTYIKVNQVIKIGANHSRVKLRGKVVTVTKGRIEESPDGMFRYFEPATNELNPTFIESELKIIKEKVKSRLSR